MRALSIIFATEFSSKSPLLSNMDDVDDFDDIHLCPSSSLRTPSTLKCAPVNRIKRARVARALSGRLDRVGVLGGENWGHTGCVTLFDRSCSSSNLRTAGDWMVNCFGPGLGGHTCSYDRTYIT
jgi:hypothetical protein